MSICLIDTTVFCEILKVPNMHDRYEETIEQLERYIGGEVTLLLPMTTIFETGNHIGQNGDGRQRRNAAKRFVEQVHQALNGDSPWNPTPFFDAEELLKWLNEFPGHAMTGSGFGDLAIIKEFDRQVALNPQRRVFIWSYDRHLSSYSTPT